MTERDEDRHGDAAAREDEGEDALSIRPHVIGRATSLTGTGFSWHVFDWAIYRSGCPEEPMKV
jgi:hypothetical protein